MTTDPFGVDRVDLDKSFARAAGRAVSRGARTMGYPVKRTPMTNVRMGADGAAMKTVETGGRLGTWALKPRASLRISQITADGKLQSSTAATAKGGLTRNGQRAAIAGGTAAYVGAGTAISRHDRKVTKSAFGVEHIAKYGAVQAAGAVGDPAAAVRDKKKLLVARPVVVTPGPSATQKIKAKLAPIGNSAPDLMD